MNTCLPSDCYIGVEVAKFELVAAVFDQAGVTTCAPAPAAVDAWLATLPEAVPLGVESTGDYHRVLIQHAHARRITVYVPPPTMSTTMPRPWDAAPKPIEWMRPCWRAIWPRSLPACLPGSHPPRPRIA